MSGKWLTISTSLHVCVYVSLYTGLTRRDLVVMAVLLGCDYLPQGLPGIGKANALKAVAENKELFEVFKTGGEGDDIDCVMPKLSQKIFE